MAEITAAAVKDLREKSGAGMMDCKKALTEANGDMTVALDWLRTKGLAAAAKKSSRTAAEGLVGIAVNGTSGAVIEVNSETDFVAKNDQFQGFVRDVAFVALELGDDLETIKAASLGPKTVEETLTNNIATIGENQSLRRARRLTVSSGAVVSYMHNQASPGLGKIGVLVALESEADADALQALGKQIAMHIAAAFPLALNEDGLDPEIVERERAIATEKAAESGKPADIIAKMVDGAIAKYRKENALVSQLLVMDGKTKISDVVANAAKAAGKPIELKDYVRFQLGEGIEKEASDFAAEVAAVSGVPQNA
ncbi:MAG: elongation factor Ts [Sphingomonas bacterium]|uniref:translation elongation factor Ts n=1 Tax=Sphingomonas bacterium TaxID=1895847 RepID=UPI002639E3CE|nr:translation elongation factor Ts [Sphingomonas bacterium]MDB5709052.1 elongation factor Ts [Sphingomonas bacterium]